LNKRKLYLRETYNILFILDLLNNILVYLQEASTSNKYIHT